MTQAANPHTNNLEHRGSQEQSVRNPPLERLLTWENSLIVLAFSLALFMRLLNLGAAPLSDREASWALQALAVARGAAAETAFGPQPAYLFFTSLLFALGGSSDFLARLLPALVGAGLVLFPVILLRPAGVLQPAGIPRRSGAGLARVAMLVAAFGLALDPGLIVISRQAGGPMPAVTFGLLALALWRTRRLPVLTGILGGLALLSGPDILFGLLSLLLAWGALHLLSRRSAHGGNGAAGGQPTPPAPLPAGKGGAAYGRIAGIAGALTILIAGTLAFRAPHGLGAWMQSLPDFLGEVSPGDTSPDAWLQPAAVSPLTILAALLVFQPFALLFAGVAVVNHRRDRTSRDTGFVHAQDKAFAKRANALPLPGFAMIWIISSLALALLYPGRQVSDLAWTLVPLWIVAAFGLAPYLPTGQAQDNPYLPPADRKMSFLGALMVLILAVLFWNTMIAVSQINALPGVPWNLIRAAVLVGILFLGALAITLIALGWSWETGRDGLVWGLCTVFLIYALNLTWGAAHLHPNQPEELWAAPPAPGQTRLLEQTLRDLSNRSTGLPVNLEILTTVDSPALRWSLRNFINARVVGELPPGQNPAVVITRGTAQTGEAQQSAPLLALADAYRGQDFVWWVTPGWLGSLPPDFVQWLAFRRAPLTTQNVILWARSDLFEETRR